MSTIINFLFTFVYASLTKLSGFGFDRSAYASYLEEQAKALGTESQKLFDGERETLQNGYMSLFPDNESFELAFTNAKTEGNTKQFAKDCLHNALNVLRGGRRGTSKRPLDLTTSAQGTEQTAETTTESASIKALLKVMVRDNAGNFDAICELYAKAVDLFHSEPCKATNESEKHQAACGKLASKLSKLGIANLSVQNLIQAGLTGKLASWAREEAKLQRVKLANDFKEATQRIQAIRALLEANSHRIPDLAEKINFNEKKHTAGYIAKLLAMQAEGYTTNVPSVEFAEHVINSELSRLNAEEAQQEAEVTKANVPNEPSEEEIKEQARLDAIAQAERELAEELAKKLPNAKKVKAFEVKIASLTSKQAVA